MKNSWDSYLQKQLRNPKVATAFKEEKRVPTIGMTLRYPLHPVFDCRSL